MAGMGPEGSKSLTGFLDGSAPRGADPAGRARHGRGLRAGRPHFGARLWPRHRDRHGRRNPRRPGSAPRLSGRRGMSLLEVSRRRNLLRRQPGAVRRRPRRRRGRGRRADGPQRHGQDDDHPLHPGPDAGRAPARSASPAQRSPACAPHRIARLGHRPRAGGTALLSQPDRRGKPRRRRAAGTLDAATASTSCSRASPSGATRWRNTLSGGEQQMLAIGRALMTNPEPADPRRGDGGAGAGHPAGHLGGDPQAEGRRPVDPRRRQDAGRTAAGGRPLLRAGKGRDRVDAARPDELTPRSAGPLSRRLS